MITVNTNTTHKISKLSRVILLLAALVGVLGATLFIRHFSTVTPEQVMTSLFDVSAPTRYALVRGDDLQMAVVDLVEKRQVSTVTLKAVPDFWAMSAARGQLFYASKGASQIYARSMVDHKEYSIELPHSVDVWQYNDTHQWLFAAGDGYATRINVSNNAIETIETGIHSLQGMFYDAFLQKLWFVVHSDDGKNALLSWVLTSANQKEALVRYPLPNDWHDFAPLSSTPDGLYLLIGAADKDDEYQLGLWDLTGGSPQMDIIHIGHDPLVRPYAGARGRYIWAISDKGDGRRIDSAVPHMTASVSTQLEKVQSIATGWLDQHLLIAGEKAAKLIKTDTLEPVESTSLPGEVLDVFITADSKTALVIIAGQKRLFALSMRDGSLDSMPIEGVTQPSAVIMGATATLCH